MTESPPKSPNRTGLFVRWWPAAIVFLELIAFSAVQAPVPGVNEPQYLGKAAHLWNPSWGAGDLFLESSNPHLFFYVAVGWLTRFVSLEVTAWIARAAGYGLIAIAWVALSEKVTGSRIAAILSAAIFLLLASIGNLSGEWFVGGIEGKVFAYGLLFLAISFWLDGRVIAAGLALGGAVSFHPIVGGWGIVCVGAAELAMRLLGTRQRSYKPRTVFLAGLGLLAAALPGAIPAAATLGGATAAESSTATFIQVFWRLRHHLDPTRFSPERYVGYFGLFAVWLFLVLRGSKWAGARSQVSDDAPAVIGQWSRPTQVSRWLSRSGGNVGTAWCLFVVATVAIAIVGIAAGWHIGSAWHMPLRDLRSTLLKFYPFRLADVFVPLAFSLAVSQSLFHFARTVARLKWANVAVVVIAACVVSVALTIELPDRNPSRMSQQRLAAWKDVAAWSRDNTPAGSVIVTPSRLWGFKWFAKRAEFVNFKDSPQEAAGLLEWKRRLDVLQKWWASSADGRYSPQDLERLGKQTGSDYLVTFAFPGRFGQPPLYDNGEFRVYALR